MDMRIFLNIKKKSPHLSTPMTFFKDIKMGQDILPPHIQKEAEKEKYVVEKFLSLSN